LASPETRKRVWAAAGAARSKAFALYRKEKEKARKAEAKKAKPKQSKKRPAP
jgi:hypothetical protein